MSSHPTVKCYSLEYFLSLFWSPVHSLLSPLSSTLLVILAKKYITLNDKEISEYNEKSDSNRCNKYVTVNLIFNILSD